MRAINYNTAILAPFISKLNQSEFTSAEYQCTLIPITKTE